MNRVFSWVILFLCLTSPSLFADVCVGADVQPTTATTKTYTLTDYGCDSFTPEAIIFITNVPTTSVGQTYQDWNAKNAQVSIGWTVGSGAGDSRHMRSRLGTDENDYAMYINSSNYADLDSFGSGTFTMDWLSVDGDANYFSFIAFGGGINVCEGSVTEATTDETDFSDTSCSFTPQVLFLLTSQNANGTRGSFGIATGASNEGVFQLNWGASSHATTASASSIQSAYVYARCSGDYACNGVGSSGGEFKSFNADGFTLTRKEDDGTDKTMHFLALGGFDNIELDHVTTASSTGTDALGSPVSFTPDAFMMWGLSNGGSFAGSFGMATDTTEETTVATHQHESWNDNESGAVFRTDRVFEDITITEDTSQNVASYADFHSFTSSGGQIEWQTQEGTAYSAMVLNIDSPTSGGGGWAHKVNGVTSPGKVNGVVNASIAKVNGVA